MEYKINKPYPSLEHIKPQSEYGKMLLTHLGGLHSEMNAVCLYFYNQIILEKEDPKLARIMSEINHVKMQHLHLIARICYHMGVNPRLWDCHDEFLEYWSPGYNVYSCQIDAMLENAILQEKQSIELYEYHKNCIDDSLLIQIIEHILLEKELHLQILEDYLMNYHS